MNFISHKTFILKGLKLTTITLLMAFGLFVFVKNQDRISSFKPYYFDSVLYSIKADGIYALSQLGAANSPHNMSKGDSSNSSLPILVYHGITENSSEYGTSYDLFKDHLFTLKNAGYETISLREYQSFMESGSDIPKNAFLLTFDDGRKDSYYPVDPLLKYLGYEATMFVIADSSLGEDSSYYLNKRELAEMARSGRWDIAAHSYAGHGQIPINDSGDKGNFYSNKMWFADDNRQETDDEYRERIKTDLNKAKVALEDSGFITDAFAYPFGDYGQSANDTYVSRALLEESQKVYKVAFAQLRNGSTYTYNSPARPRYVHERYEVPVDISGQNLLRKLNSGQPKNIETASSLLAQEGWLEMWGSVVHENNRLYISATPQTTGASSLLDGTGDWKNYGVEVDGALIKGSNLLIRVALGDFDNYYVCNYSSDYIRLESYTNGIKKVLAENRFASKKDLTSPNKYKAGYNKEEIYCGVGDSRVALRGEQIPAGGLSIGTWDQGYNNSALEVYELDVIPN